MIAASNLSATKATHTVLQSNLVHGMSIEAVFFGSYLASVSHICRSVNLVAAYCCHNFSFVDSFNQAKHASIPTLQQFSSKAHFLETVQDWPKRPLLIMAGFGYRLPQHFIDKFDKVLNLHPGNLRNNRGAHPMEHSVLEKSPMVTVTLHEVVSEDLDAGPVVSQAEVPIHYDNTYEQLFRRVDNMGGVLLSECVLRMKHNLNVSGVSVPQDEHSYRPKLDAMMLTKMLASPNLATFLEQQPAYDWPASSTSK